MIEKHMPDMNITMAGGTFVLRGGWKAPFPETCHLDKQTWTALGMRGVKDPNELAVKMLHEGWNTSIRSFVTYWAKKYVKLHGMRVIKLDDYTIQRFDVEELLQHWTPNERKYGRGHAKTAVYELLHRWGAGQKPNDAPFHRVFAGRDDD